MHTGMWWQIGLGASIAIASAYYAIAFFIARGLRAGGQLGSNRLGTGTALIFFTCGTGHLLMAVHLAEPWLLTSSAAGAAARRSLEWHVVAWDLLTAGVAVFYLSLRRSYGRLLEGPAMFDDEQRLALERKLEHQAFHDDLTGLPNRPLLMDRLATALASGMRRGEACAVLFLDLDRFKLVNDSLGHTYGDELLVAVARRLDSCIRPEDTLARLGGDEFVVLVSRLDDGAGARRVAERITEALVAPLSVSGHELFVSTSVGIAISEPGLSSAEDLLRDADIALYQAKARGPGSCELFEPVMSRRPLEKLGLETELRHALEREELELYYQPKVALAGDAIMGAEALLRWNHPRRGLVMPSDFIPLAEETALIVDIGRWVLADACGTAAGWSEPLAVCVNLSAREFGRADLPAAVAAALEQSGLAPGRLCLEVTETVVMEDIAGALATMAELKALGVELALDDFGKGHSSLTYLKRFPFDLLKIDRSFVSEISGDAATEAIAAALVTLGHALGMRIVGEGIESEFQLRRLCSLDCDLGQGFHLGRPMPAADFAGLLSASPVVA